MPAREVAFDQLSSYRGSVLESLQHAHRRVVWLDLALDDPAYDSPAFIEPCTRILREPAGSIRILLHRSDYITARAPRLMQLLEHYPGRLTIRVLAPAQQATENVFIETDGANVAVRFSHHQARGKYVRDDPESAQRYREQFESLWQAALDGPVSRPLGL